MQGLDALLLGRRTYDIFAGYWPHQEQGVDGGIAELFNRVPKYVASRGDADARMGELDVARRRPRVGGRRSCATVTSTCT